MTKYPVLYPTLFPARFPAAGTAAVTLVSIEVTPANPTFQPTASSDRLQMTATGTYSDTSTADITADVTWSSGTEAVATVSNGAGTEGEVAAVAGAITGAGAATSVITATLGAISGNTTVTVDTAVDATAGWRVPSNAYQWSLLGETPASLWLCQEASGNLADSIGSLTLVAGTTPTYSNDTAEFTRAAVGTDNATNDNFVAAAGVGPDPTTTSSLWGWMVVLPAAAPAATRDICFVSDGATFHRAAHHTTDRIRNTCAGVIADGGVDPSGARLVMLHYDKSAGTEKANTYTDQEKVTGTYSAAVVDGNKGIGNGPANAGAIFYAYGFMFSGAGAERTTASCATLASKLLKSAVSWS